MQRTIRPFVNKSLEITNTIVSTFEDQLGLPKGEIAKRHKLYEKSGSEARSIKSSAKSQELAGSKSKTEDKPSLGSHTDFGSLTFLHNRLGGLQVLPPGYDTWQNIRPIPEYAICNIGDTLTIFSGGILRSNMHRVVYPPGQQAFYDRWSVVFFLRPAFHEPLYPLTESRMVAEVIGRMSDEEKLRFYPNATAGEWYQRRVKTQRVDHMTVCFSGS